MSTYEVKINGMTCGGCAQSIEKAFKRDGKIKTVRVDLPTATARLEGEIVEDTIRATLDRLGFTVTSIVTKD